jgi:starch synthase
MKILMIAAEAVPFAKVGGLADVLGALPPVLNQCGADVRIVIPKYRSIQTEHHELKALADHPVKTVYLGKIPIPVSFYQGSLPGSEIPVYFVDNPYFYDRDGIYDSPTTGKGYEDNGERFLFFMRSALALLEGMDWQPDVIHCHDCQTGLIPAYLRLDLAYARFAQTATVFTIHNLGYQMLFPRTILYPAGLKDDLFYPASPIEFYNQVNFLKIALTYADCLNTVSESYAVEIQTGKEFGYGLEGVLRMRRGDLFGIMNGIDYSIWNPEVDSLIPHKYSSEDLTGKKKNKEELLTHCGWSISEERIPIVGMISRLTDQKGFDLIMEKLAEIMQLPLQLVILGSGEKQYEQTLREAMSLYPNKLSVHTRFDDKLAHLIEAGADLFLMPSRYEPCGLNQLYSLRYGTLPVVRATGGLRDSVIDDDHNPYRGNGFVFEPYRSEALMDALQRALAAFQDTDRWAYMMERAMNCDFSWSRSAHKYMELYLYALSKRRPA